MLISLHNSKMQLNNLCLYLLVVTTLIGSMIYIGFASLYHFVVAGFLLLALCIGVNLADFKTAIMGFLLVWLGEAMLSVLWAPDKMLALQYVYYIFLINGICLLFHCFLRKEKLLAFCHFMIVVLAICNLIAFWEIRTGNHLVTDYLSTPTRMRLLRYVPGGLYYNPNDFATYIVQIMPFSFAGVYSPKKGIRILSMFNLAASFVTICATQSRTQIIVILLMYVFFMLFVGKKELLKLCGFALLAVTFLYYTYPSFYNLINKALDSVSGKSIVALVASGSASVGTRINLLKNAGCILRDTFGFGIGAGCHRFVMPEYSAMHHNTGNVVVMHNFLGELLADYGLAIGVLFFITIVKSCRNLFRIYKTIQDKYTLALAIMLFFSMAMFVLCGASSSSIIQLGSLWITLCFCSAFIKLYTPE